MTILSAGAASWIAFYIADHLYGGRIVETLLKLASAVAGGKGHLFLRAISIGALPNRYDARCLTSAGAFSPRRTKPDG